MPMFRTKRGKKGKKYRYPIRQKVLKNNQYQSQSQKIFRTRREVPTLNTLMNSVIENTPIAREISTAYSLADQIYNNWSIIMELYENYESDGIVGIVDSEATHNSVASVQTEIVWSQIEKYLPNELHETGHDLLSAFFDEITEEEIKYVKKIIDQD